jgi:hypothetical protein
MPKRSSKKRPDYQQIARKVLDAIAPDAETVAPKPAEAVDGGKNPAAVALGRLGGLKGGKARAEKLTKEQRSEIAKNAAKARWSKGSRSDGTE